MRKPVDQIIREFDQRKTIRANFEAMWQAIIEYYLPRRVSIYTDVSQGVENTKRIYDSTPGVALLRLAAVLNSMLTNRQLEWFKLETSDEDLNDLPETKEWLEHDAKVLRKSLDSSNFYSQVHEAYIDLAGLGQFVMYIEEYKRPDKDFYFSTRHIRECFSSEGDQGETDSVDLLRSMTARQIMDRWSKARLTGSIPEVVRKDMDKAPENRHSIIQSVFPNPDTKAKYSPLNPLEWPYQVAWIHQDEKKEVHRGGYHEFPFAICQWSKAAGEDYGRGPGWTALPDVKLLYAMRKTTIRVAEKVSDPPVQMPAKGFIGRVQLKPGGLNFYDATNKGRIETIDLGANFPVTLEMIQDQRNQILDQFYTNQLQLIDTKEMTAEEARIRIAENARVIGPTFGRLHDDFLDPMINRCLGILRRAGKLMEIPAAVKEAARKRGVQLQVRFVSPLAKAQSASEVEGIQRTAATAIDWAKETENPEVLDNINFDEGIRRVADLDGTPPEFINTPDDVKKIRQVRAAAQKKQADLAKAKEAAAGIKDLAAAGKNIKEVVS